MSAIAIIPARGGSRRIPHKNRRLFHGKPIIAYSIQAAKDSGLFSEVWVSTDDEQIGRISEGYGAIVYERDPTLAVDEIGTQEVARDFIQWMHSRGQPYKYVCCIYATAPLMSTIDIARGFARLYEFRMPFAYAATLTGKHAGQFYWGHDWAFKSRLPLEDNSSLVCIDRNRVCDINTESDWIRAEQMYAALQEKK